VPPAALDADAGVLEMAAAVLGEIRKAKTTAKVSMRAAVARLEVVDDPGRLTLLALAGDDVRQAGGVDVLVTAPGPAAVTVELEEPGP
jgi:valyl-tRNA synthetase